MIYAYIEDVKDNFENWQRGTVLQSDVRIRQYKNVFLTFKKNVQIFVRILSKIRKKYRFHKFGG